MNKHKNTRDYQQKQKNYRYSLGEQKLRAELIRVRDELDLLKRRKSFKVAGRLTTVGGAATEEFSVPSVRKNMHCTVHIHTKGAAPVTVVSQKCDLNKIIVEFSADPSSDHEITYMVCS